MDQNKCVALLTAIDLGNLTRAAEQLGYTQSGLSYVIKTLETELGFPLLVRSRTGVRPTEDCQRILPLLLQTFPVLSQRLLFTGNIRFLLD